MWGIISKPEQKHESYCLFAFWREPIILWNTLQCLKQTGNVVQPMSIFHILVLPHQTYYLLHHGSCRFVPSQGMEFACTTKDSIDSALATGFSVSKLNLHPSSWRRMSANSWYFHFFWQPTNGDEKLHFGNKQPIS